MNPAETRVVFMGSPAFAVPALRALAAKGYRVAGVVTQPDRPAGRGGALKAPEVKEAALALGLPVIQPETLRDVSARDALRSLASDLFVVAAYGKILAPAVLAMPRRGAVNIHASLLPKWRGPSPITAAVLAGDAESGVSIMEMAPKMDAGAVISRVATAILPGDTAGTLEPRLAEMGARELIRVLPGWYDESIVAEQQDESQASYCKLLAKGDGHLRAGMTVEEAERAVRAYNPWPVAFVVYRGERLAVHAARILRGESGPGGSLAVIDREPAVAFEGGWLVLDEVQRTGSRRQSGREFLNGERGAPAPEVTLA